MCRARFAWSIQILGKAWVGDIPVSWKARPLFSVAAAALLDSGAAHQNQMLQLLADPQKEAAFGRVVFDLLLAGKGNPLA